MLSLIKSLVVLLTLATIILGIMLLTGNFRVDTGHETTFGIYDSSLTELPSYYNPGIETLGFIEMVSLLSMPAILLVGRIFIRALKNIPITPWAVVAIAVIFAIFIWPISVTRGNDLYDPLVSSELSYFLQAQIPLVIALAVGYTLTVLKIRGKLRAA